MRRLIFRSAVLFCAMILAGCNGSNVSFNLYLTDAPVDTAQAVVVTVVGVHLHTATSTEDYPFTAGDPVNFLNLQGGLTSFLLSVQPPPGRYQSITLDLAAEPGTPGTTSSYVQLVGDPTLHTLYIPSGSPSSITLPINFVMTGTNSVNVTVDLDLRKSVIPDPNNPDQYILIPTMRVVNNDAAGSISGTVATPLITSGCSPAVYAFSGNVTPSDVNINAPVGTVQPLSSGPVGFNSSTTQYNFTLGFLPPGLYTVAFTCQAALDDPTRTDNISFTSVTTATVTSGQTQYIALQ